MTKKIIMHLAAELHWPEQPDEAVPDDYRELILQRLTSAKNELGAGGMLMVLASSAYAINPPPPEPPVEPEEPTP